MNPFLKLRQAIHTLSLRFTMPLRIEFDVTDICNLNCKGCTHYSSLSQREYEDLPQLENSMRLLSSIKGHRHIKDIYIIGGETLLYPSLKEAMSMARHYFPWTNISIFTNGLMLPKMDDMFWELCRSMNINIAITRYPINFDYDQVQQLCHDKNVTYNVFGDRGVEGSFFRFSLDPQKRQNRWLSHFRCYSFGCLTVKGDKLFPCSISACVNHLNRHSGYKFNWLPNDYLLINDSNQLNIYKILKLRNLPVPFCAYCKKAQPTIYESSKRVKSEWID